MKKGLFFLIVFPVVISLYNEDFSTIKYHWGIVLPDQVYAGPIKGTEDPALGGISTLHYHAEDIDGNTEPDRVFISRVDLTPPSIY
jgi:hypothetical protein